VVLGLGRAAAQDRLDQPPPTDRLVAVLTDSLFSPDSNTRLEAVTWLSDREIPSSAAILTRLSRDASPEVRHQALLGLARISPSHELSRFQIRTLSASQRAALVRESAGEGLIGVGLLESIGSDETAGARERAEALLALESIEKTPPPIDRWVALIGSDVDAVRLLAALMTVSQSPDSANRSAMVARDFAQAELQHAVELAARGDVAPVIETLHLACRSSPAAISAWCGEIISTCDPEGSPAVRLVRREALRARLRCDPGFDGAEAIWRSLWTRASGRDEIEARLSRWSMEIAFDTHRVGRPIPAWLLGPITNQGRGIESRLAAEAIRALTNENDHLPRALADLVRSSDPAMADLAWSAVESLPEPMRVQAYRIIIETADAGLSDDRLQLAARGLQRCDPVGAQLCLANVQGSARQQVDTAYVLAGADVGRGISNDRLELLAALCRAEAAVSGEPTADRLELASVLSVLALDGGRFDMPIRAEAAWLAMVLRDQGSEALAHLPRRRPASDKEFRQEPSDADRLSPLAQMQYP